MTILAKNRVSAGRSPWTANSTAVMAFFSTLGVNLQDPPGKSVFFNDRLGLLFVKATEADLDIIERAIQTLNQVAPQVHIKARFVEVSQDDSKALGFDWYVGQFNLGNQAVGQAGNPGSLNVPVSPANPTGAFPGATPGQTIVDQGQQLFSSGLNNAAAGSTTATITGILTDPNFQVVLHALESRTGAEELAEPEAVTTSGRQTQMRATKIITVITGVDTSTTAAAATTAPGGGTTGGNPATTFTFETTPVETGPMLDVVPYVLSDGYTINLALIPSLTDFNGYDPVPAGAITQGQSVGGAGAQAVESPIVLPDFTVRQVVTTVNVWDNQTVVLGGLISSAVTSTKNKVPMLGDLPLLGQLFQSQSKTTTKRNLMIFVTATIVDPAGNRVHSDDELPFAQQTIPAQPPGAGEIKEKSVEKMAIPVAAP